MSKKIGKLLLVSASIIGIASIVAVCYQKSKELKEALDVDYEFSETDSLTQNAATETTPEESANY